MLIKRIAIVLSCGLLWSGSWAAADQELGLRSSWSIPAGAEVKKQLDDWLASQQLTPLQEAKVAALWPADVMSVPADQLLDKVAMSLAAVSAPAAELWKLTGEPAGSTPPKFDFLSDDQTAPFVRHNLRLVYGRWLAQNRLYDEALAQIDELSPADVVDPAALLFYQSAGHHWLLNKDKCLPLITKLMENEQQLPRRYATVGRLMEADLKPLKQDSLDEVSRLMNDIRRRLDLQRAGTRVRKQEEEVVAKLDKMIEELEKQRKKGGGGGGGGARSSSPAGDSGAFGGRGEGNVDPKSIGKKSGWGNLPPKEREAALQQIGKELPAHYREVIEEYFRRLAQEGT